MYDVLIIGGGVSGFSAGIYSSRKSLKTLIISSDVGGQVNLTNAIHNYPGVIKTSGPDLANTMMNQAINFGCEFVQDNVLMVKKLKNCFKISCEKNVYETKSVIICSGKTPKKIGFEGEKEFLGKGVFTCTTCDAPLFKNKIVCVAGNGLSAINACFELSKICKKVYLILKDFAIKKEELKKIKNLKIFEETIPLKVITDKFVKGVKILIQDSEEKILKVSGIFVKNGYTVNTIPYEKLVKLNERKEIVTDKYCLTSCNGIFASGDVTDLTFKQAVISASEGAKASLSAYSYLTGKKNFKDWTH